MNESIFQRSEFTLCDVPVPKGYPQSQTHSGVAFVGGRYYLTTSPYPSVYTNPWVARAKHLIRILTNNRFGKVIRAEAFENPLLYVGEDSTAPSTSFRLLSEKPLMDTPEDYYGLPSYNSDPDLFYDEGKFYILNRTVYRTKLHEQPGSYDSKTRIFLIKGEKDGEKFKFLSNELIREWDKPYASPCITKYKGKYIFTYLDTNVGIDGQTFDGLFLSLSDDINQLKCAQEVKRVEVKGAEVLPWHMSLFNYKERLYSIIACVEKGNPHMIWQMIGEFSDDLSTLHIYSNPLTDYNSYRGAACVNNNNVFVLYTTTVHEKVIGAKSVDGRNILLAKKPFSQLIDVLRKTL